MKLLDFVLKPALLGTSMKPAMLNFAMKPAMLDFAIEPSTIQDYASHHAGLCPPPFCTMRAPCWTVPATMRDYFSLSMDFAIPMLNFSLYCAFPALLDSAMKQALLASKASATCGYQVCIK